MSGAAAILRRALEIANQSGDLTFAGYSYVSLNSNLLAAGDPLVEVQRQVETGLAFAQKARFQFVIDLASAQLGLVQTLRGLTRKFGSFDGCGFDELEVERRFADNPNLVLAETCYRVRKLQALFFAGDYTAAVDASSRAQRLPWTSVAHFEETPEHHFYGALSRAACCDTADADQRVGIWRLWPPTTDSFRSMRRIVRKTSRTEPRWSAPRSPALRAAN